MLLSAFKHYEQGELKPEFKKGDKVYDNGELFGIVSKVTFQPLTRVHMYQFEGKGFACSALGLSKTPTGKSYKMKDITQINKALDNILDEFLSVGMKGLKEGVSLINGTYDITGESYALEFFQPDYDFLKWIKSYANNRMIIDIGCGGARMVGDLKSLGAKVMGIEPLFNVKDMQEYNMKRIMANKDQIHIINKKVEDCATFIKGQGDKILLIIARPSHSDFVINTLKMKDNNTELLFITLPENIEKYNDLGSFDNKKVLIKHEGFSVGKEIVYSLK